jgi:hypothetical protein
MNGDLARPMAAGFLKRFYKDTSGVFSHSSLTFKGSAARITDVVRRGATTER